MFGSQLQNSRSLHFPRPRFPSPLALSLRERENQGPRCNSSKRHGLSNALPTMLPLPEGEGRGEGKWSVRIPERCDFCNRLSAFDFWNFGLWQPNLVFRVCGSTPAPVVSPKFDIRLTLSIPCNS